MARKILKVAGIVAAPFTGGASLALTAGASLLGKKKKSSATPTTPDVPTMPLPDDQAVANAKKEAIIRQRARGGRSSTILTGGDTLGGY
jgi:hypothetical protein